MIPRLVVIALALLSSIVTSTSAGENATPRFLFALGPCSARPAPVRRWLARTYLMLTLAVMGFHGASSASPPARTRCSMAEVVVLHAEPIGRDNVQRVSGILRNGPPKGMSQVTVSQVLPGLKGFVIDVFIERSRVIEHPFFAFGDPDSIIQDTGWENHQLNLVTTVFLSTRGTKRPKGWIPKPGDRLNIEFTDLAAAGCDTYPPEGACAVNNFAIEAGHSLKHWR